MINNIELTHFTLADIIERRILFTKTNTLFDQIDYQHYNGGEIQAYEEMLSDVKEMREDAFVEKYLGYYKDAYNIV